MASSTIRWWRRLRIRLRMTMADETARRRTRVAVSAVYDVDELYKGYVGDEVDISRDEN